jgi:hypothetical protein
MVQLRTNSPIVVENIRLFALANLSFLIAAYYELFNSV